MKIELEIGQNLQAAIEEVCHHCSDDYNLGDQVQKAFGIDFAKFIKEDPELKDLTITVERKKIS